MQVITTSLEKIRWHGRAEKLSSLSRNLRNKAAEHETISFFEKFLNLEQLLKSLQTDFLHERIFSNDEIATISSVCISFEHLKIPANEFTKICLSEDKLLNQIKCNFITGNHVAVETQCTELFQKFLDINYIDQNFTNHSKYTWRLISETGIALSIVFLRSKTDLTNKYLLNILHLIHNILIKLIKTQEQALIKRIKTSPSIFYELLDLLFLVIVQSAKISIKFDRYSLKEYVKNSKTLKTLDLSAYDHFLFLIPVNKINISLLISSWFNFLRDSIDASSQLGYQNSQVRSSSSLSSLYLDTPFTMLVEACIKILGLFSCSNINPKALHPSVNPSTHSVLICIYTLINILTQTKQYQISSAFVLKYIPFFFEDARYYFLLACLLYSCCHFIMAAQMCRRVLELNPNDIPSVKLLLNILINHEFNYNESLKLSSVTIQSSDDPSLLLARAVCLVEKSIESFSPNETIEYLNSAKVDILKALELDDNDHEIYFYAGLIFILLDDSVTALNFSGEATKRSLFDIRPYNLLFLILVYKGRLQEAFEVLSNTEQEFPNDFGLLLNKINFELHYLGPELALNSAKKALEQFNSLFEIIPSHLEEAEQVAESQHSPSRPSIITSFSAKSEPVNTENPLSFDGVNLQKQNIKIIISTTDDSRTASFFFLRLLCLFGEIYHRLNDKDSLIQIVNEIFTSCPLSPDSFLAKAKYHDLNNEPQLYLECLETALSLEPNHFCSLQKVIKFYLEESKKQSAENKNNQEELLQAEEAARHFVKVNAKNFIAWQCLGKVLHEANKHEESAYCLNRALELESIFSILPFKSLFRHYKPCDVNLVNND